MKKVIKLVLRIFFLIGTPITLLATVWLKLLIRARATQVGDLVFMRVGLLPILDHYHQPLIDPAKHLKRSLREDRALAGIDFNVDEQLRVLGSFTYAEELKAIPLEKTRQLEFFYNNGSYESGDAEYLYCIVRHFKPRRVIEIGSGSSTLMVRNAIARNRADDPQYACRHICIEPFEQPWLEQVGVELMREKVEDVDRALFQQLKPNDILFIDSSHVIRPQGDVLFEFLEILPALQPGVLVHVHDIFTPKDYLDEWVYGHVLWNEQYLLEAFLSFNTAFKIIGALNFLAHQHPRQFAEKFPVYASQLGREPGAFWMVRQELLNDQGSSLNRVVR